MMERYRSVATRRSFLATGAAASLAAACAPAAAPPAAAPAAPAGGSAAPAWEQEWKALTEAARKEGKLVIATIASGVGERKTLEAFQDAFPGINVEQASFTSVNLWGPKALQEREGKVYTYDLQLGGGTTAPLGTYKPQGMYDPIRPQLFRPDVADSAIWTGGLDVAFRDNDKNIAMGFALNKGGGIWVNTDLANPKTVQELLSPAWKGKLAWADPRNYGYGYWAATGMRRALGDQSMKVALVDQQPSFSRDARQLLEWVVRGQSWACVGGSDSVLRTFTEQGIGKTVKNVLIPELSYASATTLYLINRAPHPNAAKLFVNWLLSKEGQTVFSRETKFNSARKDVPVVNQLTAVTDREATELFRPDHESAVSEIEKTQEIAKDLLK